MDNLLVYTCIYMYEHVTNTNYMYMYLVNPQYKHTICTLAEVRVNGDTLWTIVEGKGLKFPSEPIMSKHMIC